MGHHKGKKWKEKGSNIRYWQNDHRFRNKYKRVLRCNGEAAADNYIVSGKRAVWGLK